MAQDLKENKVGKGEYLVYSGIFLVSVIWSLALILDWSPYVYEYSWLRILDIVLILTTGLGTIAIAYLINKKGDGRRFWYRYISLYASAFVFTTLIALVLGVLLVGVDILYGSNVPQNTYDLGGFLLEVVLSILFFFLIAKYMRVVSAP
ncbi:hypothetical protein KKD95_00160 [Patescibacteria group bacterium]|nr:hypothetical protein [Patescibacteria group bacterium]